MDKAVWASIVKITLFLKNINIFLMYIVCSLNALIYIYIYIYISEHLNLSVGWITQIADELNFTVVWFS